VLVTHDRYLLDRVSSVVWGLDGEGRAETFADYAQWESWQTERRRELNEKEAPRPAPELFERPTQGPKKLSYLEAREYAEIEERIIKAEQVLQRKRAELENPAIASDGAKLVAAHDEMEAAQKDLNALYARWAELEEKADTLPRRKP